MQSRNKEMLLKIWDCVTSFVLRHFNTVSIFYLVFGVFLASLVIRSGCFWWRQVGNPALWFNRFIIERSATTNQRV